MRQIATRTAVIYLGSIVEIGEIETVFQLPAHPYTGALIAVVPMAHPELAAHRQAASIIVPDDLQALHRLRCEY